MGMGNKRGTRECERSGRMGRWKLPGEREREREIMVAREVPKMSRVLRKVHDLP